MPDKLYRIKPLVWIACAGGCYAEAHGGWYAISHNEANDHSAWRWRDSFDRHVKSLKSAKEACEAHNVARLESALTEEPTDAS